MHSVIFLQNEERAEIKSTQHVNSLCSKGPYKSNIYFLSSINSNPTVFINSKTSGICTSLILFFPIHA